MAALLALVTQLWHVMLSVSPLSPSWRPETGTQAHGWQTTLTVRHTQIASPTEKTPLIAKVCTSVTATFPRPIVFKLLEIKDLNNLIPCVKVWWVSVGKRMAGWNFCACVMRQFSYPRDRQVCPNHSTALGRRWRSWTADFLGDWDDQALHVAKVGR